MPNPSFEDITHCPIGIGDFSATNWYSPTWGSPDLLHECYSGLEEFSVGVPQNVFGSQMPRTGIAYAGFHFSAFEYGSNGREYIQCKLTESLIQDSRYIVEFYVSRGESSSKACNLAALISMIGVSATDNFVLQYVPQVVSPPEEPIVETENWVSVSDTIVALGGEQFLTIGLFTDDGNTFWVETEGGNRDEPYYYIDDVSVIRLVSSVSVPNVFTPNDDNINDELSVAYYGYSGGNLTVYDRWGRKVFFKSGGILEWDGRINGRNATDGVYFLLVELIKEDGNRTVKKGFVHLLR